ncbi:Hypothetical protein MVR_LOCUS376 [uncultured virus]|nr:Hypothetical protein MVR_LOCUS376 [uncultured virus]
MHPDDIAEYDIPSTATLTPFDASTIKVVKELTFFGNQLYATGIYKPTFSTVYNQLVNVNHVIKADDGKQFQIKTLIFVDGSTSTFGDPNADGVFGKCSVFRKYSDESTANEIHLAKYNDPTENGICYRRQHQRAIVNQLAEYDFALVRHANVLAQGKLTQDQYDTLETKTRTAIHKLVDDYRDIANLGHKLDFLRDVIKLNREINQLQFELDAKKAKVAKLNDAIFNNAQVETAAD